jgi:deoxycytidine triphosphate deaminase
MPTTFRVRLRFKLPELIREILLKEEFPEQWEIDTLKECVRVNGTPLLLSKEFMIFARRHATAIREREDYLRDQAVRSYQKKVGHT